MAFANSLPCILFSFNPANTNSCAIHYCDNNLQEIFGIPVETLLVGGKLPFDTIDPECKGKLDFSLAELVSGHLNFINVRFTITKNGEKHWFLLQATPKTDSASSEIEARIFEITEQYAKQEEALASSSYFMHLLDQLPDRFYFKDRHSRFLGGNEAWRKEHQIENMEDWIGKSDLDSPRFTPDLARSIFNEEQQMLKTGTPIRSREKVELADGQLAYSESIKTPVYDSNHQVIGLVGLTRDITQQVETEIELEKAKEKAEQAAKAKSDFLAVMSHEIRTPMNGVIGCASLLSETNLTEDQRQLLKTIQMCGESLLTVINDILDYSKIESGHIDFDHHEFDLRNLIEETLELFNKNSSGNNLELNYYIEPDVPLQLESDSSRIRQVLINLVGNAVKFTHEGEVIIHVTSTKKDKTNNTCELQFQVKDTGIGIKEEAQPQLFSAFTQADNSITRKYGGTGLGLAISKKIVELLGGNIWFNSAYGEGTSFFFKIPLNYCNTQIEDNREELDFLKNKHILIVDDNATNRKILAATLLHWGMKATAYSTPENALENIKLGHHFDAAIIDQCMPGIPGNELAKQIQSLQTIQKMPIIILSSAWEKADIDKSNYYAFLQKPARNKDLFRNIVNALNPTHKTLAETVQPVRIENRKTRILVVEDNNINQMVIGKMLEKLGYINVTAVSDGTEAVDICRKMPIDVILMDVQMVIMDGYTATEKIRSQHSPWPQPWIIALTAGAQESDFEKALACGMNAYATKPIQLEELSEILSTAEENLNN